jgi:hypothetical protein
MDIDRYVRLLRLDDEEKILVTIPFLKGRAAQWIRRKERMHTLPRTWDVFIRQLHDEFKPAHSDYHLRNRLFNLSQQTTVEAYTDCFQDCSLDIDDLPLQEAKFFYIRGLKLSVRTHVIRADPIDLDQAIHLALAFDDGNMDSLQPLEPKWQGPYQVIDRRLDYRVYKLEPLEQGLPYQSWVHTNRLSLHRRTDCPLSSTVTLRMVRGYQPVVETGF